MSESQRDFANCEVEQLSRGFFLGLGVLDACNQNKVVGRSDPNVFPGFARMVLLF